MTTRIAKAREEYNKASMEWQKAVRAWDQAKKEWRKADAEEWGRIRTGANLHGVSLRS